MFIFAAPKIEDEFEVQHIRRNDGNPERLGFLLLLLLPENCPGMMLIL